LNGTLLKIKVPKGAFRSDAMFSLVRITF